MVQMKRIDTKLSYWIENEKVSIQAHINEVEFVNKIHNTIPPIFESYCKIFHPFEVVVEENETLTKNERYGKWGSMLLKHDNKGIPHCYEVNERGEEIDIVKRKEKEQHVWESKERKSISWKSVTEKYGLNYHSEINPDSFVRKFQQIGWPSNLGFPSEGFLPQPELEKFLEIAKKHTPSGRVYIYQKAPNTIWKNNEPEDLVLCSIAEVKEYFTNGFVGYMYDEERRWIIFNDTDLYFSIVGGTKKLITDLQHSQLETLECREDTRVDNWSDKIN